MIMIRVIIRNEISLFSHKKFLPGIGLLLPIGEDHPQAPFYLYPIVEVSAFQAQLPGWLHQQYSMKNVAFFVYKQGGKSWKTL